MFYYYCLGFVIVAVILLFTAWYLTKRDEKVFTGKGLKESFFMRHLIDSLLPAKKSTKEYKWKNMITILDNNLTIRDILFARIVATMCAFVIAIAIVFTNVITRYDKAFEISTEVPIQISNSDYEILVKGLTMKPINRQFEEVELYSNIGRIEAPETKELYSSIRASSLYDYCYSIHQDLSSLFGFIDVVLVLGLTWLGWICIAFIFKACFNLLVSNELFEFDNLETDIAMMSDLPIMIILQDLEKTSLFYREMFYKFRTVYADSEIRAYEMVFNRREFPEHFKKLIRYLNMIDLNGPVYAKKQIMSTKSITEKDVLESLKLSNRKKIKVLNIITTVAFMLGFIRVLFVLFSSL